MALADPQSMTIGTAQSLPKIASEKTSSEYVTADGKHRLIVSQLETKGRSPRYRTLVRVEDNIISTDPLSDLKSNEKAWINIVIDRPTAGFTEASLINLVTGPFAWLTASTNANLKSVLGRQH